MTCTKWLRHCPNHVEDILPISLKYCRMLHPLPSVEQWMLCCWVALWSGIAPVRKQQPDTHGRHLQGSDTLWNL